MPRKVEIVCDDGYVLRGTSYEPHELGSPPGGVRASRKTPELLRVMRDLGRNGRVYRECVRSAEHRHMGGCKASWGERQQP
jgi:hypothetical protein